MARYATTIKDKKFRKWLEEKKNIDPRILFALGKAGTIGAYRREYNCWMKFKKMGKVM